MLRTLIINQKERNAEKGGYRQDTMILTTVKNSILCDHANQPDHGLNPTKYILIVFQC